MIILLKMVLTINGHAREFPQLSTDANLSALIEILGLKGDRVAIERNGEIVSRADWPRTLLADQDKLEVVHFVGGGSLSPTCPEAFEPDSTAR